MSYALLSMFCQSQILIWKNRQYNPSKKNNVLSSATKAATSAILEPHYEDYSNEDEGMDIVAAMADTDKDNMLTADEIFQLWNLPEQAFIDAGHPEGRR